MLNKLLIAVVLSVVVHAAAAGELLLHAFSLHKSSSWTEDKTVDHYLTYTTAYEQQVGPNQYQIIEVSRTIYLYSEQTTVYHKYNTATAGIGYITDNSWLIGTYRNSFGRQTVYFGKQFPLFDTNLSANLAVATGYEQMERGRSLIPMVAFDYKIRLTQTFNVHTTVVPPLSRRTTGALMVSVGHQF